MQATTRPVYALEFLIHVIRGDTVNISLWQYVHSEYANIITCDDCAIVVSTRRSWILSKYYVIILKCCHFLSVSGFRKSVKYSPTIKVYLQYLIN